MKVIGIPVDVLRAAMVFTAKSGSAKSGSIVSYYATSSSVKVEVSKYETRLIATNGSALFVYALEDIVAEGEDYFFYIPNSVKIKSCDKVCTCSVGEGEGEGEGKVKITIDDRIQVIGNSQDDFPGYTQVLEKAKKVDGVTAQFDIDQLALFSKAYKILNRSSSCPGYLYIHHNGRNPALIDMGEESVVGVLMPLAI